MHASPRPEEVCVGNLLTRWDPDSRILEVRLAAPGTQLGRTDAALLIPLWRTLVGEPPTPCSLLVDADGMVTADAHWRAAAAELTVEHGDVPAQAYSNADPDVRVSATMFLQATSGRGRVLETEVQARRWLAAAK